MQLRDRFTPLRCVVLIHSIRPLPPLLSFDSYPVAYSWVATDISKTQCPDSDPVQSFNVVK